MPARGGSHNAQPPARSAGHRKAQSVKEDERARVLHTDPSFKDIMSETLVDVPEEVRGLAAIKGCHPAEDEKILEGEPRMVPGP